jgi:hypothetical protein
VDGYLEFTFQSVECLERVMEKAIELRVNMSTTLNDKLSGEDIKSVAKRMRKRLIEFAHARNEFT